MWSTNKLQKFEAVEPHMGTLIGITVYTRTAAEAAGGFRRAYDRIAALNRILSDYLPDSEINQLGVGPRRVSAELYRVLQFSKRLSELTDGAFDVTVGPLTRLWRRREPLTAEARALVNWRELHLEDGKVWLGKPHMKLDLGAIGKGYAADEALKELKGVDALIAASGDIVCQGSRDWSVRAANRTIRLRNAAISTSGDTNQFVERGGARYSHILDPRTGMSFTDVLEVSVVAKDGMTADALATAVRVMGTEKAAPVLKMYGAKLLRP